LSKKTPGLIRILTVKLMPGFMAMRIRMKIHCASQTPSTFIIVPFR
jgi:hypothetical protein